MPGTNQPLSYREYEDHLLDRLYEVRERYEHATTYEDKLALGEQYRVALCDLEGFLTTAKIPEKPKVGRDGPSTSPA